MVHPTDFVLMFQFVDSILAFFYISIELKHSILIIYLYLILALFPTFIDTFSLGVSLIICGDLEVLFCFYYIFKIQVVNTSNRT